MHPKTLAQSVLLIAGTAFVFLIVFLTVRLVRGWAESADVELSGLHKAGITALAFVLALVLLGQVAKLISGDYWRISRTSREELDAITNLISIIHPARRVLKNAGLKLKDVEGCAGDVIRCIEQTTAATETRKDFSIKVIKTLEGDYPCYVNHLTLSFAQLALERDWMPQPQEPLELIARASDEGALGWLILDFKGKRNDYHAELAKMKHREVLREKGLSDQRIVDIEDKTSHRKELPRREGNRSCRNPDQLVPIFIGLCPQ